MTYIYYVSLGVIFALFVAKNFKTKVLTAQKKSTFWMSDSMMMIVFDHIYLIVLQKKIATTTPNFKTGFLGHDLLW